MPDYAQHEERIFEAARRIDAPEARHDYLLEACFDSPGLLEKIEALLAADACSDQFFEEGFSAIADVRLPAREALGDYIGRYRLLEKLGEGGCGVVYLAEQQTPIRRRVALKIIKLGMDTRQVIARFEAERHALALMDHPNIAHIFDGGATESGRPYFVMEFVRGTKVTAYCDQHQLSIIECLDLFVQICQAVQHAHQKGVIHRDLKPSNILVEAKDGTAIPKVIDFGIAKAIEGRLADDTVLTAFEQFIGTPAYVSPEQASLSSVGVDTRTDIYSLGVLLYELLTGKTPFDTTDLLAGGIDRLRATICYQEPTRPSTRLKELPHGAVHLTARQRNADPLRLMASVAKDLDWVVMKCLEKDRSRRYQTVNALAMDIQRFLHHEPVLACPPSPGYRATKFIRRHRVAVVTGMSICLLLLAGGTVSTFEAFRARRAEEEQSRQRAAADKARHHAEDLLAKLELEKAEMLFAANNSSAAIANLARLLRENPSNSLAATRLLSSLIQRSFFVLRSPQLEHEGEIRSLQFSPDGRRLASASMSREVHLYNAQSGELEHRLRLSAPATWASFTRDGSGLVTGTSDGQVQFWNAETGESSGVSRRFQGEVFRVDFSPSLKDRLVVAAGTKAFLLDALASSAIELPHSNQVRSARFSPDGKLIVTASFDQTVQLWDALTGKRIDEEFRHPGRVWSAEFSRDGERLLTAGASQVRLYEVKTGKLALELPRVLGEVYFAQFSPDGRGIFLRAADRSVRFLDAATGAAISEPIYLDEIPMAGALSPDGTQAVATVGETRARLWRAPGSVPRATLLRNAAIGPHFFVTFSHSGQYLATSGLHQIDVWDVPNGTPVGKPLQHPYSEYAVSEFSADEQSIATGCYAWIAAVWEVKSGDRQTPWLKHQTGVNAVHLSPNGHHLLTSAYENGARIWDLPSGKPLLWLPHSDQVTSARYSKDGKRVVTTSIDNTVKLWDAQTGNQLIKPLRHPDRIWQADFSSDGEYVATACQDKFARIWNGQTGELRFALEHREPVSFVQFSPEGHRLLTRSNGRVARLWNLQETIPSSISLQHPGDVISAVMSEDGQRIATSSLDLTLRVWDGVQGHLLAETFQLRATGTSIALNANGSLVAAACDDGATRIWEVPSPPLPIPGWMLDLAEALVGQRFTAGGGIMHVPPEASLQARNDSEQHKADDYYRRFADWFFSDPATRTVTPSSKQTVLAVRQAVIRSDNK